MDFVFSWENRVYFGDTDAAGIVYHGRYVYWMEAARIDFLRHIGCPYSTFISERIGFSPVNLSLEYKLPLRFEDQFRIDLSIEWIKKASFCIRSVFYVGDAVCTIGVVTLASVDESRWKACPIPQRLRDALEPLT